jgi:hypothetical protein
MFGRVVGRRLVSGLWVVVGCGPEFQEVFEVAEVVGHGRVGPVGWFPVLVFAFVVPSGG